MPPWAFARGVLPTLRPPKVTALPAGQRWHLGVRPASSPFDKRNRRPTTLTVKFHKSRRRRQLPEASVCGVVEAGGVTAPSGIVLRKSPLMAAHRLRGA